MMVKPADADGDAEMNVGASTDATVEPAVERETSNEEEEEEEDAMDALLGVGREIGDDDAHGRDDRAADDDAPAAGDAGDDDEDMDEDDTAEGSPERKPEARTDDMDESAKMLMLLGELGGDEDDTAGDEASEDDGDGSSPTKMTPSKRKKPERLNASNGHGAGAGSNGALAATQSGPVGEWLKAEGEARMKMADHRRLIYRWTNAIYRLLGMKIPRGMGSLFDKGEKNKREKFDRFLSYYYGTETFEPGTYWYNNADTIQFFIELVRIATCNRTVLEPITIQKLFRKKDPTRQASTWIMVQEELDKTNVTAAELRALFEGPPRMENGFPRGRPLFVPIPKNPKGHHKYNRADGGGESVPPSPAPPARERPAREKRPSASARSSKQTAPTPTASAVPNMANFQAMAAAAGMANMNPGFAAAAAAAAQAHAAAIHQHTAIAAGHARTFAAHEAMMRSLAGVIPGGLNPMDPAAANAINLAQRQNSLAALFQNGFVSHGSPGTPSAMKGPRRDAREAHEAELARAEAAPGACAGVTLAPGSSPTHMPGGIASPYGSAGQQGTASSRLGHKRAKAGDSHADVIRRIDDVKLGLGGDAAEADLPPAPTRLVGEILFGTLRDVVSDVFGLSTKVSEALGKEDDRAIVEEGKERLMSIGELINANLPDLTAAEDDTGRAGGGREPTVDRTGVKAQVDSVIVAAKAAESTWRRFNDASLRALAAAREAKGIDDRMETARAELAGAKLARDAVTQHSMDVDPAVRAAMRATIEEKIAKANAEVASFADEHAKFSEAEAEARAAANASARAFRPPYEEVRKRTLRIRLHAEERAERQIGRALSRADRDLQHKDQKLKELGFAKDPVVKPEIEEIERKREIVREGRKKIKAAHEGCKTAIEWCKREIAACQTALDV
mmetsp:Transcript_3694/g.13820  ORF Transcript_3694/g.13820 Transcript_3694/m.13820 type:complete len:906 (-) Transcript_3694:73-2790(-)